MVHSLRRAIDAVQTLFEKVAADTQSPAFRQWFGASKVVDEHGDPLVVYHGTMFTFSSFSPGSHFGDLEAANARLTNSGKEPHRFRDHHGSILPVYLSIRKPLRIIDRGREHDGYELADNARDQGAISDAEYKSVTDTGSPGIAKLRLFAVLARHGYDGLVYRNTVEGSGDSWIPFQANQVKSVFNSGEWSQRSGNISETALTERQALENDPAFQKWFAGSKVVDKHGRPLPMYHGTQSVISAFRPGTHFGTYVAANQRVRKLAYGAMHANIIGSNLIPVYLRIVHPLRVADEIASEEATLLNYFIRERKRFPTIDLDKARREGAYKAAQDAGYDGLVYRNGVEDRGRLSWVVFDANQVKSAISNTGDYSASPHIHEMSIRHYVALVEAGRVAAIQS